MTPEKAEQIKTITDLAAYSVATATVVQALPSIAAAFSIVWMAIQISQSKPFKQFIGLFRCLAKKWRDRKE